MTSLEIRKRFLDFFGRHNHAIVSSSSLIPDDPSVLFTTAGMQQFKRYYTGELNAQKDFGSLSTASIQKCFRTSDIEEVGDATHLTFFEMLGNFSFGGYFKKEAITLAHEFITKELELPISYVTVFKGSATVPKDEESKQIWKSLGVHDVREEGMNDVFWGPTGTAGPCGPTTEIYCRASNGKDVEIWNIVFNQFFYPGSRDELLRGIPGKSLAPLGAAGIDTGAGFERIVTIKQGCESVYETDVFREAMTTIADVRAGVPQRIMRVIADHLRASYFLIADGVRPGNKEAGYILRRLLRRVCAYMSVHDIHAQLFEKLLAALQKMLGDVYPELKKTEAMLAVVTEEYEKFSSVLANGLKELQKLKTVSAKDAFYIYESFGLPLELIKEMAPKDATQHIDQAEFDKAFAEHQALSRVGAEKKFGGHGLLLDTGELKAKDNTELEKVIKLHTATHLLQQALRDVLGNEVAQKGSDITAERLRFDFSFPRKVAPEELAHVEDIVNQKVVADLPVAFQELPKEEAAKTGALYFFKQKYPEKVKVYYVGHSISDAYSKEFCGGPHVDHTGTMGKFKILKEEAVAAGVRRIRATVV